MIGLKRGVKVGGIQPEILLAVIIGNSLFDSLHIPFIVTSGLDSSVHMTTSLHYKGQAIDIRLPSFYNPTPNLDSNLTDSLRNALGEGYDVVLEKDHIHIEYDPKPIAITEGKT